MGCLAPYQSVLWHVEASLAMDRADWDTALQDLEKAEKANGPVPSFNFLRAIIYNSKHEPEKARDAVTKFLENLGDDAFGYRELANAQLALGERDKVPCCGSRRVEGETQTRRVVLTLLGQLCRRAECVMVVAEYALQAEVLQWP